GLARFIRESAQDRYTAIGPVEKRDYYVLSSAQKRLYILQQMEPQSTAYNMPQAIPFSQAPDLAKLEGTFKALFRRHESLRTSFVMVDDQPVQRVHDEVEFGIKYYDWPTDDTNDTDFNRFFMLSEAPLLRVGVVKRGENDYLLLSDMHHIISDAASNDVLRRDFLALYNGGALPPLRIQYKDFSVWQNHPGQLVSIKQQETFWLKEFAGEIPVLNLPMDYPRPTIQSFEGGFLDFQLPVEESRALRAMALSDGYTVYMVLLAAFNILLSKLSGQEDIIVGSPVVGRRHADLEEIIGMFVNTLALRNYPEGEHSFMAFLQQLGDRTLAAFENQEFQFEDLVEKVSVTRDAGRNPLFDVLFLWQDRFEPGTSDVRGAPAAEAREAEVEETPSFENLTAKFDLTLVAMGQGEGVEAGFQYCTRLFKEATIQRFITYFKNIVSVIVKRPEQKISGIEMMPEAEKRRILLDFNDTSMAYPEEKTIHQLFEEQAVRTPGNLAVVSTGNRLTYRGLSEKSGSLAGRLREKGVGPGSIVGIMMERSPDMVTGILGILKAGAAYLPIDPGYPEERINYMMKDSGAKILLSELSEDGKKSTHFTYPTHLTQSNHLSYVIYTSGTTGTPKGVMVNHRGVVNLLTACAKAYPFGESDAWLLKTSYMFDVSVTELFGWFCGGGRLVVLESGGEKDPQVLLDTIAEQGITHINFVPAMFNRFVNGLDLQDDAKLSGLKYMFLAGEALFPEPVRRLRELGIAVRVENLYGPTEATVYASRYSLADWDGMGVIPIGRPMENLKLYVLGSRGGLQPVGVPGELVISGVGLARGYLNRPELTAENFNRFYKSYRTYKTGDLARWLPDWNIEFLGRIDRQVKIRGFRIELGEIETRLLKHPEVKEAVVVDRGNETDRYLCAYIVSGAGIEGLQEYLSQYLSRSLPEYMIPSYFMEIEKIPLSGSGKVDRKALPLPAIESGSVYAAPGDGVEKALVEIWTAVLVTGEVTHTAIGIDDNFFKLGGHSLKAVILLTKIHKAFNVKVALAEIFKTPTIRGLARFIRESAQDRYTA
ncbi:MAG: amino acid adenylation domain-containing protein, partial [bacterium]|nr:amino acid adenylation domain-containing protein [bacterium]